MSTVQRTMDAVIVTGEYTDNQGQPKKRYMNIGTLFIYQDGGMSLKLDAVPIGNGNISFYEKKPKGQATNHGGQANSHGGQGAPQATPQNNMDSEYRHNAGGNANRPPNGETAYRERQDTREQYYDAQGNPIPV